METIDNNGVPTFLRGGEVRKDTINSIREIIRLRIERNRDALRKENREIEKREKKYLSLYVKKILALNFSALL